MYPISNAAKALFESEQKKVLRITGTDRNGVAISITDANVMDNGFAIDRCAVNNEKIEIGTAIASEMTLKLDNRQGQFSGIVFEGAELFVEIGIADWTESDPTITWIPCGYFTPDEQPRTLSTISITALDRMSRFDYAYPIFEPWGDGRGNIISDGNGNAIYFSRSISFPKNVQALVNEICTLCDVPFTQSITSLPNYNLNITGLPELNQTFTLRNMIQWCAGIMGCNAWIDWTGSLRFSPLNGSNVGYTTTVANRFSSDLYENDITITGVRYSNTQGATIVSGTNDYPLDLTGNYLLSGYVSTVLPALKNRYNGYSYRPFSATVKAAPYLWPMDTITFTDKDGNDHSCLITNVNFTLNGTTSIESKGKTNRAEQGVVNGVTTAQGYLIEKATERAKMDLDEATTQEAIFNRLTNNGQEQALILYEGRLYLNASYIQTGTLVADLIKGGTLTLGGLNNENGTLRLLNAANQEIGLWNNEGIFISSGYIRGPEIDVGGSNQSGRITVHDSLNNVIGKWDSNGLNANIIKFNIHANVSEFLMWNGRAGDTEHTQYITIEPTEIALVNGVNSVMINGLYPGLTLTYADKKSVYRAYECKVDGTLTVTGTKSRVVSTDQYSDRLLYCYETPSPMFGDIGEGTIGEDGLCYVTLDPIFAQTISTDRYQVFLQKYCVGECYVSQRKPGWFVVTGTPGMAFGWEIKAKQRDFDQRRLERNDEPFTIPTQTYGQDAAQHIQDIMKERISA